MIDLPSGIRSICNLYQQLLQTELSATDLQRRQDWMYPLNQKTIQWMYLLPGEPCRISMCTCSSDTLPVGRRAM